MLSFWFAFLFQTRRTNTNYACVFYCICTFILNYCGSVYSFKFGKHCITVKKWRVHFTNTSCNSVFADKLAKKSIISLITNIFLYFLLRTQIQHKIYERTMWCITTRYLYSFIIPSFLRAQNYVVMDLPVFWRVASIRFWLFPKFWCKIAGEIYCTPTCKLQRISGTFLLS